MSEKIEAKADKYLVEGRVTVREVAPAAALVEVRGTETYRVRFVGAWTCDCPSRVDRCAHVVAASKVVSLEVVSGKMHLSEQDPEIDFLLGL